MASYEIRGPRRPLPTAEETWTAVDDYHDGLLPSQSALSQSLHACVKASQATNLPDIAVSRQQGVLLEQLCSAALTTARAKGQHGKVVELGLLGAYSTLNMLAAMKPGEQLATLEIEPEHIAVGDKVLKDAGYPTTTYISGSGTANDSSPTVTIVEGKALESLEKLAKSGWFGDVGAHFWFIDADKDLGEEYVDFALKHSPSGALIFFDNAIRRGSVVEPDHPNGPVQGVRRMNAYLAKAMAEGKCTASWTQTVGNKGYDGFCLIAKA